MLVLEDSEEFVVRLIPKSDEVNTLCGWISKCPTGKGTSLPCRHCPLRNNKTEYKYDDVLIILRKIKI